MRRQRGSRSLAFGALVTAVLTVAACTVESRRRACVLAWQACLTMRAYHPPDMPGGGVREGTPVDPLVFFFGASLGVPIYGGLTYAALCVASRCKNRRTPFR
ncbi:MAG TPA: hypothetical protein VF538_06810 [Pyrinomonadaceae bacterium]|jgi:hypothetical protein